MKNDRLAIAALCVALAALAFYCQDSFRKDLRRIAKIEAETEKPLIVRRADGVIVRFGTGEIVTYEDPSSQDD